MPHLVAHDLSLSIGPAQVLRAVSFTVSTGQRVGLVGANGAGKTTLLRLLAGELEPTSGVVERHPAGVPVGLLHQEVVGAGDGTVSGHLSAHTGVGPATVELEAASAALAGDRPGADDRYTNALERWLLLGGADFDHRADQVLEEVGLGPGRRRQRVATLSGGQRARLDLAAVLLHQAPILLLDEPTNDLDNEGLQLLEEHLLRPHKGLVIVSHDRALLRAVVTDVAEIDDHTGTLTSYAGGWAAYQDQRLAARAHAEADHQRYVERRNDLAERARRQREWARHGVTNAVRRPRDGDKNIRQDNIARAQRTAGRAARTERELARLAPVAKPFQGWRLDLDLATAERSGDLVAELCAAVVQRGSFTLGPVDLALHFGDRVALVGANGSGKSTLVAAMLGRLPLTAGHRRLGPSVVVGELGQDRDDFAGEGSLLEAFTDAIGVAPQQARSSLAKLGLGADDVDRPARSLSPGERTRAVLAGFQVRGANLLVLDEPTNHLDLEAIEQLEDALADYPGTLVVVSHDRAFVEALAVDGTWQLHQGRLVGPGQHAGRTTP